MARIRELLRPAGLLVMTSPFGQSRMEETQRIYSAADLRHLLTGFRVKCCHVARRKNRTTWEMERNIPFLDLDRSEGASEADAAVLLTAELE